MQDNNKLELPGNSDQFFSWIAGTLKLSLKLMFIIIVVLTIIIWVTLKKYGLFLIDYWLIIINLFGYFLLYKLTFKLHSYIFSEYVEITNGKLIYYGAKISGSHKQELIIINYDAILLIINKLPLYGYNINIQFSQENNNKYDLIKNCFVYSIDPVWGKFVEKLSMLTKLPVKKNMYLLNT